MQTLLIIFSLVAGIVFVILIFISYIKLFFIRKSWDYIKSPEGMRLYAVAFGVLFLAWLSIALAGILDTFKFSKAWWAVIVIIVLSINCAHRGWASSNPTKTYKIIAIFNALMAVSYFFLAHITLMDAYKKIWWPEIVIVAVFLESVWKGWFEKR